MNTSSTTTKNSLKWGVAMVLLLVAILAPGMAIQAQQPVPTLVPPTKVPTVPPQTLQTVDTSGVLTLQNDGVLRVGARYNLPPFSYLDNRGQVTGYEVAIVRAIATELGIGVEWVQVTSENEEELLLSGEVDMLVGEQIVTRDAHQRLDFTHPLYLNRQMMVVLESAPYQDFASLNGQTVGIEVGSRAADAVRLQSVIGLSYNLQPFLSEGEALDALARGDIQAMVGQYDTLINAGRSGMRFIQQPVELNPYAIALRRYDVNLRNILNRSIQRIYASNGINGIFREWFPNDSLDFDVLIPKYEQMYVDERTVADYPWDIPRQQTPVVERIRNGETLNVAGLSLNPDAPFYDRQLDVFNQALVDEMGRRWGVPINYMPDSYTTKLDLLFAGLAHLAVGVTPVWDGADRFDYSRSYFNHSNRLIVLEGSSADEIRDLRGGDYIAYWYEDGGLNGETAWGARAEIERLKTDLLINPSLYELRSLREIVDLFSERTIKAIFGDTLRLRSIIEGTRSSGLPFVILDEQYNLLPITFALPRNDPDFRNLVDFTIQDMFLDGTYQRIFAETLNFGEVSTILTFPGDGRFLLGR